MNTAADRSMRSHGWMPVALLIAGTALYLNGLSGPFIFDDEPSIPENPRIRNLWPPWQAAWAPKDTTAAGRPVAAFSLALNYLIDGLNVVGYHVFNVTLHILATLTLFGDTLRECCERSAPCLD